MELWTYKDCEQHANLKNTRNRDTKKPNVYLHSVEPEALYRGTDKKCAVSLLSTRNVHCGYKKKKTLGDVKAVEILLDIQSFLR